MIPAPRRLDSLEGLRFVSSLMIVAGHYVPYVVSTPLIGRLHLAVDLFFVISGIVIAELYAGRIANGTDYLRFMSRRFARLYPLHLATLAFYVAIGVLVWGGRLQPVDAARYDASAILPNLLLVHAWSPAGTISFNYVSWSISAEFFVYLAFPLILMCVRRAPLASLAGIVVLTALLAVIAAQLIGKPLTKLGWEAGILRALPGFAFGVWLSCHAEWLAARAGRLAQPTTVAGLAAVIAVLMAFRADEFVLLGLIWSLVAAAFLCDRAGRATWAATPWLARHGELTYSIYMLHTVVATVVLAVVGPRLLGTDLAAKLVGIVIALAVLALAARLSHDRFEQPLRRRINAATDLALAPRSASTQGTDMDLPALLARFQARDITVGVIGLGYVGLPLCIASAAAGLRVVGFDIDADKPRALLAGETYLSSIPAERVATLAASGRFDATTDFARLAEADAIVICVPTPLTQHREPDLSYVTDTATTIARTLRPGQLVVLESTTWPGTTAEAVRPILDVTGLACGSDYFLAFSPEREDPGNPDFGASNTPKVVGADDDAARDLACALYAAVTQRIVPVSSTRAAEAVKLTENIFRAVNIAMVNEMKTVYAAMGIDIWEVIDAAKTKPFGYMPFYPGPGLGGHCIPIDPFYLTWKAREFDIPTRFIELAGEINTAMPRYVVEQTASALDLRQSRGLNGARVLLLGVAYKKNVNDMRESPALKLIELFQARGAIVDYADPHVPALPPMRAHPGLTGMTAVLVEELARYDAAVIVTDHDAFDYASLVAGAKLVVDTRNACGARGLVAETIVKA